MSYCALLDSEGDNMYIGRFLRRYKRFMVDIETEDGQVITVHCPNSGRMTGLLDEGNLCAYTLSPNPNRKLPHTLEMIKEGDVWVGVNTQRPNHLVREWLQAQGHSYRMEVPYDKDTRFDFALMQNNQITVYGEVKNVHMKRGDKAYFPDAPTTRGQKHLDMLCQVLASGLQAHLIYVIQRPDCTGFAIADDIDPLYAQKYAKALALGLTVTQLHYCVSPQEIRLQSVCSFDQKVPAIYGEPL